jgi:hypothetical protein
LAAPALVRKERGALSHLSFSPSTYVMGTSQFLVGDIFRHMTLTPYILPMCFVADTEGANAVPAEVVVIFGVEEVPVRPPHRTATEAWLHHGQPEARPLRWSSCTVRGLRQVDVGRNGRSALTTP